MIFKDDPGFDMTIGFHNLTREQVLYVGLTTAKKLKWHIHDPTADGFIATTDTAGFSWGEIITVTITGEKISLRSELKSPENKDFGNNKANVHTFIRIFRKIAKIILERKISVDVQEILEKEKAEADLYTRLPDITRFIGVRSIFAYFRPLNDYFITPILININLLIFLLMFLSGTQLLEPSIENLINWGANSGILVADGEYWRLLTSCFIHIGPLHLLMNLLALCYVGLLLEPLLGRIKFLFAYILSGLSGAYASIFWDDLRISAGASGAIFGMLGVLLALLTTNLIDRSVRKDLRAVLLVYIVFNLLYGLFDETDDAAHIGGLACGIIIGYLYSFGLKKA